MCRRTFFFFFKQKTAYEMLSGDWSSDVCSSDLRKGRRSGSLVQLLRPFLFSGPFGRSGRFDQPLELAAFEHLHHDVGAADELALDVKLGDRRPVGIFLDALADLRVLEHVDGL